MSMPERLGRSIKVFLAQLGRTSFAYFACASKKKAQERFFVQTPKGYST
ncbi:hypothetical protein [Permianibacter aggregans]|uniref:Uncharacterized protein n=1 Tax=Permianibacter aggregans TaxID=1510150 RepID=A0A4R6UKW1_9GAMM|nr:hypothetical protein [Permianibacter aggregans]TDQ47521.1 hypothetical protein EV696_110113 [Permianibacter aggregans]